MLHWPQKEADHEDAHTDAQHGVHKGGHGAGMEHIGYPDYSEVFDFGSSGKYTVTVLVKRKGTDRPTEATFVINRHL